jgi:hypothetical protein
MVDQFKLATSYLPDLVCLTFVCVAQNVDADAAKKLMAYLVERQSTLPEVNKWVSLHLHERYCHVLPPLKS